MRVKVRFQQKNTHITVNPETHYVAIGPCVTALTNSHVWRAMKTHLGKPTVVKKLACYPLHAVRNVLADPMAIDHSPRSPPSSSCRLRLRALLVLLTRLESAWPHFELQQEIELPSDLNLRARMESERPFEVPVVTRPSPTPSPAPVVTPSTARQRPATMQLLAGRVSTSIMTSPSTAVTVAPEPPSTAMTVAPTPTATVVAPAPPVPAIQFCGGFDSSFIEMVWRQLWSKHNGDIIGAVTEFQQFGLKQEEIADSRRLAKERRDASKREFDQANESAERTSRTEEAEAEARITLAKQSVETRTALDKIEIEKAQASLDKIKAGPAKRRLKVFSPAEMVRVANLLFQDAWYTTCHVTGCRTEVCLARVHMVVTTGYKPGMTNEELASVCHVYCSRHKDHDAENTLGRPQLFEINQALLAPWMYHIGLGTTRAKCMLCGTGDSVTIHDAHACHDIAASLGGNDGVKNVWVGHQKCNTNQGTTRGSEYRTALTGSTNPVPQPNDEATERWKRPLPDTVATQMVDQLRSHGKKHGYGMSFVSRVLKALKRARLTQLKIKKLIRPKRSASASVVEEEEEEQTVVTTTRTTKRARVAAAP